MQERDLSRICYPLAVGVTLAALAGGVVFFTGIHRKDLFQLLLIFGLFIYLHAGTIVKEADDPGKTLSSAVIFPIVYVYGTTAGMLLSVLAGIVDGRLNRRSLPSTLFNSAQFALGSLMNSLLFVGLGRGLLGMAVGGLANIAVMVVLASALIALRQNTKWWSAFSQTGLDLAVNYTGTAFIGVMFALFLNAYHFWGLLAFGLFLIHLSYLFQIASEISDERLIRRELEEELLIDGLTQAYNFRFLSQWLNTPVRIETAVLYLDVDDFKEFNDLYSHEEGSRLLQALVEVIISSVRAEDKVVRYGGDEFVVLLPGMGREGAYAVAERILANVKELSQATWDHKITVSIGIAIFPHDTSSKRQLLLMADQAMYRAKDAGKEAIRMWTPQEDLG